MRSVFHCAWVVSRGKSDRGDVKPFRHLQGMPTYVGSNFSCDTNHISNYRAPSARERLKDAQGLVRKEEPPVDLMKELLHRYINLGAVVVDVFGGAFSMGLACVYLGRQYVSYEIDKRCFDAALKRLKSTVRSLINSGKLKPSSLLSRQLVPELSLSDWKALENLCSTCADGIMVNAPPAIMDAVVDEMQSRGSMISFSDIWTYMQYEEGIDILSKLFTT